MTSKFQTLQTSGRQSIRFYTDYTNLSATTKYCSAVGQLRPTFIDGNSLTCESEDILTDAARTMITGTLMPEALSYLSRALKVTPMSRALVIPSNICGGDLSVPASLSTAGARDTDYVIFVTAGPTRPSGVLAFAGACAFDPSTDPSRPIVGLVNFNPASLSGGLVAGKIRTAIHEIMHALGFSGTFIADSFLAPNKNPIVTKSIRGKSATGIVSAAVLEKARIFFNCPTLSMVELEDQGGQGTAGSHWEKRTLLNELMTGVTLSSELELAVSSMTLALFQDSGYYDVNYAAASPAAYFWHDFSLGCGFLESKCNVAAGGLGSVFCLNTDISCTRDHLAIGRCNLATFDSNVPAAFQYTNNPLQGGSFTTIDYCPIVLPFSSLLCVDSATVITTLDNGMYFGSDSRCFHTTDADGKLTQGGLHKPTATNILSAGLRCLRHRCQNETLQVQPGDSTSWISCPKSGGSVSAGGGFLGNVVCPPVSDICITAASSLAESAQPVSNSRAASISVPYWLVFLGSLLLLLHPE